jgi:hypothetical protein
VSILTLDMINGVVFKLRSVIYTLKNVIFTLKQKLLGFETPLAEPLFLCRSKCLKDTPVFHIVMKILVSCTENPKKIIPILDELRPFIDKKYL